jgi:hypothetical protein
MMAAAGFTSLRTGNSQHAWKIFAANKAESRTISLWGIELMN